MRLDLGGAPEVLTVLSGREASVRRLDGLRASLGDDPEQWFPALTGHPWPGTGDSDGESDVGQGGYSVRQATE